MITLRINGHDHGRTWNPTRRCCSSLRDSLELGGNQVRLRKSVSAAPATVLLDGQATRSCQVSVESVGRKAVRHHHRGDRARSRRRTGRQGLDRWAGGPMRLLPVRPGHGRHKLAQADPEALGRRHRRRHDQSLPLRHLQRHRRRRAAGRRLRGDAMNDLTPLLLTDQRRPAADEPVRNLSAAGFLGAASAPSSSASTCRSTRPPPRPARRAPGIPPKPGTRVAAFLEIRPDSSVACSARSWRADRASTPGSPRPSARNSTSNPARFTVECVRPAGLRRRQRLAPDRRLVLDPLQLRGDAPARRHRPRDAAARRRRQAPRAAGQSHDRRRPGRAQGLGRSFGYGELAAAALALQPRDDVKLKDPKAFPVDRQAVAPSTCATSPPAGPSTASTSACPACCTPPSCTRRISAPSRRRSPTRRKSGRCRASRPSSACRARWRAVVAGHVVRARKGAEGAAGHVSKPAPDGIATVSAGFSSAAMLAALMARPSPASRPRQAGRPGRRLQECGQGRRGGIRCALPRPRAAGAALGGGAHRADGSLDLWLPTRCPSCSTNRRQDRRAAARSGPDPLAMLGGFFGRHFYYGPANPFPQAILLAKALGKPVRVLWFARGGVRHGRVRPLGLRALSAPRSGPTGCRCARDDGRGRRGDRPLLRSHIQTPGRFLGGEGLDQKPYAIPTEAQYVKVPTR